MDDEFEKSLFTSHFNCLLYLGFWKLRTDDVRKKFLYSLLTKFGRAWVVFMSYMGILDFFYSMPVINKVVYNVCINIFMMGTFIKALLTVQNADRIDSLRMKLHRSIKTCKDPTEEQIFNKAIALTRFITKSFYVFFMICVPPWLVLSYLSDKWGERMLPMPGRWPVHVDIYDSKIFYSTFLFQMVFANLFLVMAMFLDVSMFGLLSQIHREYEFLIKRISEFSEFCDELFHEESEVTTNPGAKHLRETNVFLKKAKVKQRLREIILRQKDLLEFTEDFDFSYNKSMFVHIFAGGTLLCVNGIQAMIFSFHFDIKMAYQFGYVGVISVDMLYLCWLTDRISTKCTEVGNAFYGTSWYKLDSDVQKDICLIILRSQRPPRITSGRFVVLNLQTSMALLKNIYSWLAMFRQVVLK